jgi:hypothetical protein
VANRQTQHDFEFSAVSDYLAETNLSPQDAHDSQFDPCLDWRAELVLGRFDLVDCPDVLGGYVDFLTIRLGEQSIPVMLDALSSDAENFAGLFDGRFVAYSVQDAGKRDSAPIRLCGSATSA